MEMELMARRLETLEREMPPMESLGCSPFFGPPEMGVFLNAFRYLDLRVRGGSPIRFPPIAKPRLNSLGVAYFNELCGRTVLYSRRYQDA